MANNTIAADSHRHFLKPEQEIRNYYLALTLLEKKIQSKEPFSKELILETQVLAEKGASKEKEEDNLMKVVSEEIAMELMELMGYKLNALTYKEQFVILLYYHI